MPLKAPASGKDFERCPTGLQPAVCVYVVDCGLQTSGMYGDKHKCRLIFETEALMTEGEYSGKPFMQSTEFTLSMFKSALLRTNIESWRGKSFTDAEAEDFDLLKLVGQQATLNIIETTSKETGKAYSNIGNILPGQKGKGVVPSGVEIPQWIQDRAKEGLERMSQQEMDQRPEEEKNPPLEVYEGDAQSDDDSGDLPF